MSISKRNVYYAFEGLVGFHVQIVMKYADFDMLYIGLNLFYSLHVCCLFLYILNFNILNFYYSRKSLVQIMTWNSISIHLHPKFHFKSNNIELTTVQISIWKLLSIFSMCIKEIGCNQEGKQQDWFYGKYVKVLQFCHPFRGKKVLTRQICYFCSIVQMQLSNW